MTSKCQSAKPITGQTALVEHDSSITIPRISLDQDGNPFASPSVLATFIVLAFEFAHHVGRVLVVAASFASVIIEPRR